MAIFGLAPGARPSRQGVGAIRKFKNHAGAAATETVLNTQAIAALNLCATSASVLIQRKTISLSGELHAAWR